MPLRIELIGETDNAQLFFGIQALDLFNNLSSGHFSNTIVSERDNQREGDAIIDPDDDKTTDRAGGVRSSAWRIHLLADQSSLAQFRNS
jgi:hypothetical protein